MNSKAYKTYEISENEYRELKYFCLRYSEMKAQLNECRGIRAVQYGSIGAASTALSNPTERTALKAIQLSKNIDLIDRALALTADEPVRNYLKQSVINPRISYDSFDIIPMGRRQFYEMRRKFFYILKTLKMG